MQQELQKKPPKKNTILALSRETYSKKREDILVDSDEISATSLFWPSTRNFKRTMLYVVIKNYSKCFIHFFSLSKNLIQLLVVAVSSIKAVEVWERKWVPAFLDYSLTLSGKKATLLLAGQKLKFIAFFF